MKNKVYVYSKEEFREKHIEHPGAAFISIEATPDCAKYWLEEEKEDLDNEHILPEGPNVLNLNFDDLTDEYEYEGHTFTPMTFDDAVKVIDFVDSHVGKDLVIHCKAGASRSQGVAAGIVEKYFDDWEVAKVIPESYNHKCKRLVEKAWWIKHWDEMEDSNRGLITIDCQTFFGKLMPNGYLLTAADMEEDYYWAYWDPWKKTIKYSSCVGNPDASLSGDKHWGPDSGMPKDLEEIRRKIQDEAEEDAKYFLERLGFPLDHPAVVNYIKRNRILWWTK